ncbi:MAG: hypothetical protein A3D28_04355 [Omnitrophica bacterium RIFCSPHIGHO2_02_FULL_63_14]|nr:MAG: hypothetical protein A3D28_04355 [Omnitrophica bacterium RIFCSPHIGHO2_02_FULL_63_14]
MKKLKVYIDGASRGNPGPAAVGIVFQEGAKTVKTLSEKIGVTTNNVAEYYGLVLALQEALMMRAEELDVFTDSELLARQFNGEYKIREDSLKLLAVLVRHLKKGFKKISVRHVPREENRLADKEANQALDGDSFL